MVSDDEFSTFTFMGEGAIISKGTYLVQRRSQRGETENIELKDTWSTPDIEEYTIETPRHETRIAP